MGRWLHQDADSGRKRKEKVELGRDGSQSGAAWRGEQLQQLRRVLVPPFIPAGKLISNCSSSFSRGQGMAAREGQPGGAARLPWRDLDAIQEMLAAPRSHASTPPCSLPSRPSLGVGWGEGEAPSEPETFKALESEDRWGNEGGSHGPPRVRPEFELYLR